VPVLSKGCVPDSIAVADCLPAEMAGSDERGWMMSAASFVVAESVCLNATGVLQAVDDWRVVVMDLTAAQTELEARGGDHLSTMRLTTYQRRQGEGLSLDTV
jgi:hypothetical protein